jgi:hypothetical protein
VESGASRDEVVGLLEEAVDRLDEEDSALRAQVLAALARELYLSGVDERVRAGRLSSAAVEIARRVRDDATLATCLLAAHDTIWQPGTGARRRAIAAEMGVRAGDRAFEAEACLLRASAGLELGDAIALDDLEEFVRLGAAVGQPHFSYLVLTRRAMHAIHSGRFPDADRLRDEASALAEARDRPRGRDDNRQRWPRSARHRSAQPVPARPMCSPSSR